MMYAEIEKERESKEYHTSLALTAASISMHNEVVTVRLLQEFSALGRHERRTGCDRDV